MYHSGIVYTTPIKAQLWQYLGWYMNFKSSPIDGVFRTFWSPCSERLTISVPVKLYLGQCPCFLFKSLLYSTLPWRTWYVCSQAMILFSLHVWQSHRWFACWKLQLLGSKCVLFIWRKLHMYISSHTHMYLSMHNK